MNEETRMSQHELLEMIHEFSFAINDVVLYLDMHPTDCKALSYYQNYKCQRKKAVEEYTKYYGPITADNVCVKDCWSWIQTPWPWEGGC